MSAERVLDRLIPAGVLIGILLLGLVTTLWRLSRIIERANFLNEFTTKFGRYVHSQGEDESLYVELTGLATRMQRELGAYGIMAMYRPPFAGFAYRNYPVILNMLPEYRETSGDPILQRNQAPQYASAIRDVLIRYSGALSEREADVRKELRNPLIWFREGVKAILATPVVLLETFGILTPERSATLIGSGLLRIGAGVIALIGLAAALVQIITGWDATIAFVRRFK
jgi:hypothetical protein